MIKSATTGDTRTVGRATVEAFTSSYEHGHCDATRGKIDMVGARPGDSLHERIEDFCAKVAN